MCLCNLCQGDCMCDVCENVGHCPDKHCENEVDDEGVIDNSVCVLCDKDCADCAR